MRSNSDLRVQEITDLKHQIKTIKTALDRNYHQIGQARKARAPFKKINALHKERSALIQQLAEARERLNSLPKIEKPSFVRASYSAR